MVHFFVIFFSNKILTFLLTQTLCWGRISERSHAAWASSPGLAVVGGAGLGTRYSGIPCRVYTPDKAQRFQMRSINGQSSLATPKCIWFYDFQAFLMKLE